MTPESLKSYSKTDSSEKEERNFMKAFFREAIIFLAPFTGIEKLLSSFSSEKRLVITYHGVVEKKDMSVCQKHIEQKDLIAHLTYFKKNFEIIPLQEMFRLFRANIHPKKPTIAITFDDGYENNYTYVFPVLKRFQIPATFFITTKYLEEGSRLLWFDYIDFLKIDISQIDWTDLQICAEKKNILSSIKQKSSLKLFMKTLNMQEKDEVLNKLKSFSTEKDVVAGVHPDYWRTMNITQLKEMAESSFVEIGSHSVSHHNMEHLLIADAITEFIHSKVLLEKYTGEEVSSFAFPDGRSYTDSLKEEAYKAGYKNLLALDYQCENDEKDKNILPRFCISSRPTSFYSNMVKINYAFNTVGF